MTPSPLHLRLPATSANLGPGFDALGLAMSLYLTIDAAVDEDFHIDATGRDAALCADTERNLILTTYIDVLAQAGILAPALHLRVHNEIPLGMGCGSSAAALLAGVFLANHFGALAWSRQQILEEACRREGHPDNVAACLLGGMTVSSMDEGSCLTATYSNLHDWRLLLALPAESLSTRTARAMLPEKYSRADAVRNIQATALLVSAFALNRGDLLHRAMQDRIHQPYRLKACPLLERLLPLSGSNGILGVALSGAGPSVLLITDRYCSTNAVVAAVRQAAGSANLEVIEASVTTGVISWAIDTQKKHAESQECGPK